MIKVSIADTENVGVKEYFADKAMVVLYDANGVPDIVGDGDITYAKKAAAINTIMEDIYQSQMSDDAKTKLISKVRRYANVLVETLEAW